MPGKNYESRGLTKHDLVAEGFCDITVRSDYRMGEEPIEIARVAHGKETKVHARGNTSRGGCHWCVRFRSVDGGRKRRISLARVLYVWFRGDIPDGYTVGHADGDASNNYPENLYLVPPEAYAEAQRRTMEIQAARGMR